MYMFTIKTFKVRNLLELRNLTLFLIVVCLCMALHLQIIMIYGKNDTSVAMNYLKYGLTSKKQNYDNVVSGLKHKGNSVDFRNIKYNKFLQNDSELNSNDSTVFRKWSAHGLGVCHSGKGNAVVTVYDGQFALLKMATLHPSYFIGKKDGVKKMEDVMNQAEPKEYYKLRPGAFQVNCVKSPSKTAAASYTPLFYRSSHANHLNQYYRNTLIIHPRIHSANHSHNFHNHSRLKSTEIDDKLTIIVTRYEYVNIYHTMTDWYNAFLMMRFFNETAHRTNIIFIDAHPIGALDSTWGNLFNSYKRLSDLGSVHSVKYKHMVWGMVGYNSPMYLHSPYKVLPYVEEFRKFFLNRHNIIDSTTHKSNCKAINILVIFRRDYVAHPRNPSGLIQRKFANEKQIITHLKDKYTGFKIRGVQLDALSMTQQLGYIAETDILIGMHGAGLTLSLFLPPGSGVIEIYPMYMSQQHEHFKQIAAWRGLRYMSWQNTHEKYELPSYYTHVPTSVINTSVSKMCKQICPNGKHF